MSGTIDNRTVQMQFDNATFESKISHTMASLDKLNKSLDFTNANKSMGDLGKTAQGFHLGGMASAVEGISAKFLAMSTIAITALANITNKAVDAGIRIAKSLTIEPIMEGFREYETNLNSIQTVLANTRADGTNLQDVNRALEELNHYSDQTIYNFGEMARNIGTFTAAGVDLDTSTAAIKGIANLAAVSGSNSQQASSAMYQLSQALSTGTLRLIDWNSVVNAGMGGEVFQKALFETGKALGTLGDVRMDKTFEQWTKESGSFRDSLESGWITTEVLTTTIQGFTGDMDAAQLSALGFSEAQAQGILEMGEVARKAATEVKTATQLMGTLREASGSGWSQSFKLIVGDFEEAKALFTEINDVVGGMIGRRADARNKLLEEWKFIGGRTILIEGLRNAFKALGDILSPIQRAFQDVFPPLTSIRLVELTMAFRDFTEKLKPSSNTITNIRLIFQGLFAAIEIGWTVLKETAKFFIDLFKAIVPQGSTGKVLNFFGDLGVKINDLNKVLVEGGGIARFFDELPEKIAKFVDAVVGFVEQLDFSSIDGFFDSFKNVKDIFDDFGSGQIDGASDAFGRLGGRFDWLSGLSGKLTDAWSGVKDAFQGVSDKIGELLSNMKDNFGNLGEDLGNVLDGVSWDGVTDGLQVGLLGAIILFVKRLKDTLDFDFAKDMMKNISSAFGELTGVLEAMQTKLKAEALEKIAIAIAILVGSVVILSMVDAEQLTKAMTALAVGFGQLIGAFALLTQISAGPASAASIVAISFALILLAGAVGLLSIAVGSMADLDWEELAKGLLGTLTLIGALALAAQPLSKNSGGMITAGLGMIAIGVALNIIALAVKQFAGMDWDEMVKGLVGVAGALGAVTLAMNFLPKGSVLKAAGVVGVAVALNILAFAVKQFSKMDWGEMAKGLVGVGGGLILIAGGMRLMPLNLPITAAGLLIVSIALGYIADAVIKMSKMSWEEIGKGMVVLGGSLVILGVGLSLMSGTIPGAIALGIAAISLEKMGKVVKQFAKLGWVELASGLGAIAAVLGTLGLAAVILAPAVPVIAALGLALILLGAGFALFGVGAKLTAEAFAILAGVGMEGIKALLTVIDGLIQRIPQFIGAVAAGLVEMVTTFLEATPEFVAAFIELLAALLEAVPQVMPALATAITSVIQALLQVIRDNFPDIVDTGMEMLLALLKGIDDNIEEITKRVISIVVKFVNTLAENMDQIVEAGVNLVIALAKAIFNQIFRVQGAAFDIAVAFAGKLAGEAWQFIKAGAGMVVDLVKGIATMSFMMPVQATLLIAGFIAKIAGMAVQLIASGAGIVVDLAKGIGNGFISLMKWVWESALSIGEAIIDGIVEGIKAFGGRVIDAAKGIASNAIKAAAGPAGFLLGGPSKVFIEIGEYVSLGLAEGISGEIAPISAAARLGKDVKKAFNEAIVTLPDEMLGFTDFQPIIVPVLDLTQVKDQAKGLGDLLTTVTPIDVSSAVNDVQVIADYDAYLREQQASENQPESAVRDVQYIQNNYSPEALSTTEIYRRTKSQIALSKEVLAIP